MFFYTTKLEKGRNGWRAETEIEMGLVPATETDGEGMRVLSISTSKHRPGIITSFARVYVLRKERGYDVRSTEIFGDYSKHFNKHEVKTVTEKTIREAHEWGLKLADTLLTEAKAKYAEKIA